MIIDCHCHAGPGDGFRGPWDTEAPLRRFMRWSREAGISRTVLFPAFHSDYTVANEHVARIVRGCPKRFWGFCFVHCERDRGRIESMVGTCVERDGFCGIKCHRMDARITRETLDAARRFNVPILYDPMAEVAEVDLYAPQYPDVNIIIPHLGSFADEWRAQFMIADVLARRPNVYTDTSGVRRFEMLQRAVQVGGAHKILFGTDGPWLHPALELAKVRLLGLAPDQERAILGGNLRRLIGMKDELLVTPAYAPASVRR
ncbi:MAG: amidohydrolase family protein [Pyrinomonadaceae bacterium]|nr:amidohydrolase family protein [Phycisphaerales bacterium]